MGEKAMKNIQQAGNEKSFKKRVEEEKEEKKEISTAKAQGEREEKIGTDELTRKKDKLARIQGKGPDAPTKRGFQGSFWSGVTGVRNVGDAIYKIEKLPPTKKETIDTIDYKSTPGYWIGLDDRFQNAFVARFRGHINVPTNGTYTFFVG